MRSGELHFLIYFCFAERHLSITHSGYRNSISIGLVHAYTTHAWHLALSAILSKNQLQRVSYTISGNLTHEPTASCWLLRWLSRQKMRRLHAARRLRLEKLSRLWYQAGNLTAACVFHFLSTNTSVIVNLKWLLLQWVIFFAKILCLRKKEDSLLWGRICFIFCRLIQLFIIVR